jgi:hypothetical protein
MRLSTSSSCPPQPLLTPNPPTTAMKKKSVDDERMDLHHKEFLRTFHADVRTLKQLCIFQAHFQCVDDLAHTLVIRLSCVKSAKEVLLHVLRFCEKHLPRSGPATQLPFVALQWHL